MKRRSDRRCGSEIGVSSPLLLLLLLATVVLLSSAESKDRGGQEGGRWNSSASVGDEQLIRSPGENLTLRCASHLPVAWDCPPPEQSTTLKDRMLVRDISAVNGSYESVLEVKDLEYMDTGYYRCVSHSGGVISSVYLYVFDEENLFVSKKSKRKYHDLMVVQNQQAILTECRTTHPDVKVELTKKRDKEINNYYSTDPRIGITINKIQAKSEDKYNCTAKYKSVTKIIGYDLTYKESTGWGPKVSLTSPDHKDNRTLPAETVRFLCSGSMFPGANINNSWSYPMKGRENGDRIKEVPGIRTDQNRRFEYGLIIYNFKSADSGIYRCSVSDHDLKTDSAELYMAFYEKPFLNLTSESMVVEAQENADRLILTVKVDAYPTPTFTWFMNSNSLNEKIQTNKYKDMNSSSLSIFNTNPSDKGLYTLFASQEGGRNATVNITVIINYPPKIVSSPEVNPRFFLKNNDFFLECSSSGCPEPVVTWEWQTCQDSLCSKIGNDWKPTNYSRNEGRVLRKGSKMVINAKESGWYRCIASNKIGRDSKTIQFFVTGIQDGFGIEVNQSEAQEGTNITALCLVNEFMYNMTNLYWTNSNSSKRAVINSTDVEEGTKFTVTNFREGHHSFSKLSFVDVKIEDAGNYWCIANEVNGERHIEAWNLAVKGFALGERLMGRQQGKNIDATVKAVLIVFGIIIASLFIVIAVLSRRTKNKFNAVHLEELLRSSTNSNYNPNLPVDEQTEIIPYDPQWEFSKDRLKLDVVIGKGAFGTVYRAKAFGINIYEPVTTVAVKTVKDCGKMEQLKALVSELKVLIHLGQHVNILNALGAVTKDFRKGVLYVIMEYCHFGCLRDYLIKQRCHFVGYDNSSFHSGALLAKTSDEIGYPKGANLLVKDRITDEDLEQPLTQKELICYAFQIARGLEYLHSKKYIHRDLAARNVLLAEGNVIKICDFGLAKDCYKYNQYRKKSSTPVPIKWMAIESLTHNLYTTKSDIWSYGVVLWELFTMGGNPYPTLKMDKTFIELLDAGYRLERPFLADGVIYKVMLHCWDTEPSSRPSASYLVETFGGMLEATVKQHYIDLRTVDYLRMNSKSGCLESLVCLDAEGENLAKVKTTHLTRQKLPSVESGFASMTKAEDIDLFEYLPPSLVDSKGDSEWLQQPVNSGKTLPSHDPAYKNAAMVLMKENFKGSSELYKNLHFQESVGSRPLSVDCSSGISDADAVFDELDSYSPHLPN